jgi:hypothetical protein
MLRAGAPIGTGRRAACCCRCAGCRAARVPGRCRHPGHGLAGWPDRARRVRRKLPGTVPPCHNSADSFVALGSGHQYGKSPNDVVSDSFSRPLVARRVWWVRRTQATAVPVDERAHGRDRSWSRVPPFSRSGQAQKVRSRLKLLFPGFLMLSDKYGAYVTKFMLLAKKPQFTTFIYISFENIWIQDRYFNAGDRVRGFTPGNKPRPSTTGPRRGRQKERGSPCRRDFHEAERPWFPPRAVRQLASPQHDR